jgi:hypothetical protein
VVSKVKSAKEKKALSLKRDRRNVYGENPQASRKGIRRGKQRSHMEERRSIREILSHLRERAEESDAIEADVLTKTAVVRSKQKGFKKTPDRPLGEVIKRKLAQREQAQSRMKDTPPVYPNIYAAEIFDTPYVRALHKRTIMFQLRYRVNAKRWRRFAKKPRLIRANERKEAVRWREAILRDAPLLHGFFAEEPQWRERMLHWCEKTLGSASDPDNSW